MLRRYWVSGVLLFCTVSTRAVAAIVFRPCESTDSAGQCYNVDCPKIEDAAASGWAIARCSNENGYIGTMAHGNTFGIGASAAEATQSITFYVENSGTIAFQARIKRVGGTVESGAAAFAGTYKVWVMDGERHTAQVDAWFGVERALEIAADLALAALGEVYGIKKAIEKFVEVPLFGVELAKLATRDRETITISDHFFAQGGYSHTIAVGLRSQASGVLLDWAEAVSLGVVEEIRVWGVGSPQPPTISGPTEACPGAYLEFEIQNDNCLASSTSNVVYKIDPGDALYEWTTNPMPCGMPVCIHYTYYVPGTYTLEVRTQEPSTGHWSVATEHDVQIADGHPVGGTPDPLLVSQGTSCTSIDVRWQSVDGTERYEIYRDQDYVTSTQDTSYLDENLNHPPDDPTYGYRIRACNDCGCTSSDADPEPYTYQQYFGHPKYLPSVPAPMGIRASDGACTLEVSWWEVPDAVPYGVANGQADGYRIYRNTVNNPNTAMQIGSTTCTGCTTFEDTTAANGVPYYYWITAYNACGESAKSVSNQGYRRTTPLPPTNVTATQDTLCDSIRIEWQGEDQWTYNVYRIESNSPVLLASGLTRTSYEDEDPAIGQTPYQYEIRSYDAQCDALSIPSSRVWGWAHGYIPSPNVVSITWGELCNQVYLDWEPVGEAVSYEVRRSDSPYIIENGITITGITDTYYSDTTALPEESYYYEVRSQAASCASTRATEHLGWTGQFVLAPKELVASDDRCNEIKLRWGRVPGAESYTVYRDDQPLTPDVPNPASGNWISFYDDGASTNADHSYYVVANSTCMQSSPSNTDSGCSSDAPPSAPTGLSAAQWADCDYVRVDWLFYSGGGCGGVLFNIYRNNTDDFPGLVPFATISAVAGQVSYNFDDHLAVSGQQHYYWVSAFNACGETFADANPGLPGNQPAPGRLGPDADQDRACDWSDNCLTVFNPSQRDCDNDGIGDACEPSPDDQDCNADHECDGGEIDSCPAGFTSCADCNFNRIPDECEDDCNGNFNPDDCDLAAHPEWDVDPPNGIIDTCEGVASPPPLRPDPAGPAFARACDGGVNDGLPCSACDNGRACLSIADCSTCAPRDGLCPGGTCTLQAPWLKNRFLTVSLPTLAGPAAIRVTLVSLPSPHNLHNGAIRWAGPVEWFKECSSSAQPTLAASRLQCEPYFADWASAGVAVLHLYSEDVIPGAVYQVDAVYQSCTNLQNPYCYSDPLPVLTAKWGDVEIPMHPATLTVQPDLSDVGELLNKFRCFPGSPTKPRAVLAGIVPDLSLDFNFTSISHCVDAFKAVPYPYPGPVTCPGDPTAMLHRIGANQ